MDTQRSWQKKAKVKVWPRVKGICRHSRRSVRTPPRPNILTLSSFKRWPPEDKSRFFRDDLLGLRVERCGFGLGFRDEIYPRGVKVLAVDPNEDNLKGQHSRPFARTEDLM